MTQQTLVLPYQRSSPLHIPRRDLVLSAADNLSLRVSVVESDDPGAPALELTGGLGGPALTVTVWRDSGGRTSWDYGAPTPIPGEILFSGTGTDSDAVGSFDLVIPAGTMAAWPLRCGWAVRLWWDDIKAETLAEGTLNVRPAYGAGAPASGEVITTDTPPLDPITTD